MIPTGCLNMYLQGSHNFTEKIHTMWLHDICHHNGLCCKKHMSQNIGNYITQLADVMLVKLGPNMTKYA